jgi:hypothetical protein
MDMVKQVLENYPKFEKSLGEGIEKIEIIRDRVASMDINGVGLLPQEVQNYQLYLSSQIDYIMMVLAEAEIRYFQRKVEIRKSMLDSKKYIIDDTSKTTREYWDLKHMEAYLEMVRGLRDSLKKIVVMKELEVKNQY